MGARASMKTFTFLGKFSAALAILFGAGAIVPSAFGQTPSVSIDPSSTSVQSGGYVSFSVSATCNTGLNEIGLESCDGSGNPTANLGAYGVSGNSASGSFGWSAPGPGTYYFDAYAWNQDRSVLTRTGVVSVSVVESPPSVSISSSASSVTAGQTVTFTVSAYCGAGLGPIGLESCDSSGNPTSNLGQDGASGTSAYGWFNWSASSSGTYYFDAYAWSADYSQLTRTGVISVTVVAQQAQTIWSANASLSYYGTSYPAFTPSYLGGSVPNAWQFCIVGYTNWNPGNGNPTGTEVAAGWEPSWTPPVNGNYQFYIANNGNSNYETAIAGPYSLGVTGPVNNITWNSINAPTTGLVGQTISIVASVTNSGTTTWDGTYYLQLEDQNGNHLNFPSIAGVAPGGTLNAVTFSLTLPSTAGTYTYYLQALQNNVQYFGPVETIQITVSSLVPQITSSLSVLGNVGVPISYQIVATNNPSSYGASSLPPGLSVNTSSGVITGTPTTSSIYYPTITATNSYGQGQAPATFTISPALVPVITSATSASGTVGSPFSYQITATNNATSFNASNLPSGLSVVTGGLISGTPLLVVTNQSVTLDATNSVGTGTATIPFTIHPGVQSAVSISPTSPTGTVGQAITLTASGGTGTGAYTWGGSASGTGQTTTVSFASAGSYSVSMYRSADANYGQSSTASVTVVVSSTPPGNPQLKLLVPTTL